MTMSRKFTEGIEEGIQQYFATEKGKEVENFIKNYSQDVVVRSINKVGLRRKYRIKYSSPVWGDGWIKASTEIVKDFGIQRGDILKISNVGGEYIIQSNETQEQKTMEGFSEILKNFDDEQKRQILVISTFRRAHNK